MNYAQLESAEALQAMLVDPLCAQHLDEVRKITEPDYRLYRVYSTHVID